MTQPPEMLPYAKRPSNALRASIAYVIDIAALLLGLWAIHLAANYITGPIRSFIRDFRMELPAATEWSLAFVDWFLNDHGWLWLLPAPFVLPLPMLFLRMKNPNFQLRGSIGWSLAMCLALCLLAAIMCVAMDYPLFKLMGSLTP